MRDYIWWPVPSSITGLPKGVTLLVIESIAGKRTLFVPGRRVGLWEAERLNEDMVVSTLRTLIEAGWDFRPQELIALPILTEGLGVPFISALHRIWPDQEPGGRCVSWLKRKKVRKAREDEAYDPFEAEAFRIDTTAIQELEPGLSATGLYFDIGATGTTIETHVRELLRLTDRVTRLIYASPAASLEAARRFVEAARSCGLKPENLAVVPNEGFLGLDRNGTFLSFQLPGTITSQGNVALSQLCYPHPRCCHIGAGGLRVNSPGGYRRELQEDEEGSGEESEEVLGRLPAFTSLAEVMVKAEVSWSDDFGSPFE